MTAPLLTCPACHAFAPRAADRCPHCDARIAGGSLPRAVGRALLATTIGGTLAMTLMACYGGPPRDLSPQPVTPKADCGVDEDNNGVCAPTDCNDKDPAMHDGCKADAGP